MGLDEKIVNLDIPALQLIRYPDPRLREVCTPVVNPSGEQVRRLVERMQWIMIDRNGVGLAASQVGVTVRLFVASPTCRGDDLRVYINPRIVSVEGTQDSEEGCLSFPDIFCRIKRANSVVIQATDLDGRLFEETGHELAARIFLHEYDHLEGRLLVDRMGSVSKLANRNAIKHLEQDYQAGQEK